MEYLTADLFDTHGDDVQVVAPLFRDFGGRRRFHGRIATVKVHEDNSLVRDALSQPGDGRVLVIDGGGSLRCALLGDNLAQMGAANGWAGVGVYGCIRDSVEIGRLPLGVKALATHPAKSVKRGEGRMNEVLRFAETIFLPGAWLYADEDGILVAQEELGPGDA